jgi:protocatechuate 3,4-dioxygenase beta subunit
LSLVIDSPRGLSGIVLDEENQPISQFSVSVFNKELGTGRSATLTGGAGQWQIEGVMPGQIVVAAHDATGRESEMELRLKPGQDIKDLRMVLKSASKTIA